MGILCLAACSRRLCPVLCTPHSPTPVPAPPEQIVSYDAKARKHKVRYRDGDTQELVLRDEAVQYLEKEGPPARVRGPDPRRGGGRGAGAAGAKRGGGGGTPRAGKRGREGSAGVEGDSFTGDAPDEPPRIRFHHGGGGQEEREAAGGFAAVPVAAPATASPPKDVVAGSHDVSAIMGDSEEGPVYSEGPAHSEDAPSSSGGLHGRDAGGLLMPPWPAMAPLPPFGAAATQPLL